MLSSTLTSAPSRKLGLVLVYAKRLLTATFQSPQWASSAKEDTLTLLVSKFAVARQSAAHSGCEADERGCDAWLAELACGEQFVRLHRIYVKHHKHCQLMSAGSSLARFLDFMRDQEIEPHASLTLLLCKVAFFSALEDRKEDTGLYDAFSKLSTDCSGALREAAKLAQACVQRFGCGASFSTACTWS